LKIFGRALELIWFFALGAALIIAALTTDRHTRTVEENPSYCDPFGYLQMAQLIRHGAGKRSAPQFTVDNEHTRLLIERMQLHQIPVPVWDEMVAPLACHYFPKADHVGLQYSPGAGLMLSLFPEGRALRGLNLFVVLIFLIVGLALLVVAAIKQRPIAAGFVVLALNLGLEVLAQLHNASFSINTLLVPLLLSGVLMASVWLLPGAKARYLGWLLMLLSGLLFGFAVLTRMPVILLMPGILLVLWPVELKRWYRSAWVPFILGVALGGVIPVMVHQSRVAGAWYLPTYTHENTTPPTSTSVMPNLSFYFGPGKASVENWVIPVILIGCLGLAGLLGRQPANAEAGFFVRRITWFRLAAAALLMVFLSTIYFLTHTARVYYYPFPALFGALLLLALGAYGLERRPYSNFSSASWARRILMIVVFCLALTPGLAVISQVWLNYIPATDPAAPKRFTLPAELADDSAWIWACELSGTFWYYARKPAHKVSSTNRETREIVFKYVVERGERQYIVTDDDSMKAVADEIIQMGGTLEQRGEVDGYPYFLIHWPPDFF
jgi:hypothetical protein